MVHFFFYALSVSLYSAAVFVAGMYVGEKLERAWGQSSGGMNTGR